MTDPSTSSFRGRQRTSTISLAYSDTYWPAWAIQQCEVATKSQYILSHALFSSMETHVPRYIADLPIAIKGIQTHEDAALCMVHGVQGVWLSNHGGRQLEGFVYTIENLSNADNNVVELHQLLKLWSQSERIVLRSSTSVKSSLTVACASNVLLYCAGYYSIDD